MYFTKNVGEGELLYRDGINRVLVLATPTDSCTDGKVKSFTLLATLVRISLFALVARGARGCCWCSHHNIIIINAHAHLNVYVRAPFHTVTHGEARTPIELFYRTGIIYVRILVQWARFAGNTVAKFSIANILGH